MAFNHTISAAEAAIGPNTDGDHILKPELHAGDVPEPLKSILLAPDIQALMDEYRKNDTCAEDYQKIYRKRRRLPIHCLAYAAALTGGLAAFVHVFVGHQPVEQLGLIALHVMFVIAAIALAAWTNRSDPRRKWLQCRANAELRRVALFERVFAVPNTSDRQLLPLQLAYFRRYQLGVQLSYFATRGAELTRPTGLGRLFTLATLGIVFAVGLFAAAAAVLHGSEAGTLAYVPSLNEELTLANTWYAYLALIISTAFALLMTHQDVTDDQRNGARYLTLRRNFQFLMDRCYEPIRQAADRGAPDDRETVLQFVRLVHSQMLAEQMQWTQLSQWEKSSEGSDLTLLSIPGLKDVLAKIGASREGLPATQIDATAKAP